MYKPYNPSAACAWASLSQAVPFEAFFFSFLQFLRILPLEAAAAGDSPFVAALDDGSVVGFQLGPKKHQGRKTARSIGDVPGFIDA